MYTFKSFFGKKVHLDVKICCTQTKIINISALALEKNELLPSRDLDEICHTLQTGWYVRIMHPILSTETIGDKQTILSSVTSKRCGD